MIILTGDLYKHYKKRTFKINFSLILFSLLLISAMLYLLSFGSVATSINDLTNSLNHFIYKDIEEWTRKDKIILLLRLPRIVMAVITGASLAIAGTVMQSIMRNPLVSPFTIGVSASATFGAALFIMFGSLWGYSSNLGVVMSAFLMGLASALMVYLLSKRLGTKATTLILIGVACNYLFTAGTSILQFFADEYKLAMIVQWSFGGFSNITWSEVMIASISSVIAWGYLHLLGQQLNAMGTGDDELLTTLGINPEHLRRKMGIIAIFITAVTVCFTGVIGFVGLIGPHMARMIVGNNHNYLIPLSGLIGATLVLVADALGHWLLRPVVLPVGIVIAFVGVPLFIQLILQQRRIHWE